MSVKLKIESSKGSDDLELSGGEEVADKVVKEAPSYPFGCHSGSCGVCRAQLKAQAKGKLHLKSVS